MDENLKNYLKEKYPESFEGWDGYEFSIRARMRKGEQPEMLAMIQIGRASCRERV